MIINFQIAVKKYPKRKFWIFVFALVLSWNLAYTFQKLKNTTGSRPLFKFSYFVVPIVHNIRFRDERLTLQDNQEVFIKAPLSGSFECLLDAKLGKNALLYIFFHLPNGKDREGYAFRVSALPGVPTAFLRYDGGHVAFKKTSFLSQGIFSSQRWRKIHVRSKNHRHELLIDEQPILTVYDLRYTQGEVSIASGIKSFTVDNLMVKSDSWTYFEDFSVRSKNNKNYRARADITFSFVFFLCVMGMAFALSRFSVVSEKQKDHYIAHLRMATVFLVPGALLASHDRLCFLGTFAAILIIIIRTTSLWVKTNTIFIPADSPEIHRPSHTFPERFYAWLVCMLLLILMSIFMYLHIESYVCYPIKTCVKTLHLAKDTLSFRDQPYFLADFLNIRNPVLSFDLYGKEGLALLVVFNKFEKETSAPYDSSDSPAKEGYAMLLSFHKTLPTVLMRGQNIVKAATVTPFLKDQWNHVEIITSGRNILFLINGKQILSYNRRKIFCGGIKILPVYHIPEIRALKIYNAATERSPQLFSILDTVFFLLRLLTFLWVFLLITLYVLYDKVQKIPVKFFLKRAVVFFFIPFLLWCYREIVQHSGQPMAYTPLFLLIHVASIALMVMSFFLLIFLICKRMELFHRKQKIKLVLLTFLFLESFCYAISPYLDTVRKPWYVFVHDQEHYWYFDPQVRLDNGFFSLNMARAVKYPYLKNSRKRMALIGSSSAQGQFFQEPSSEIFSAQLEKKLLSHGNSWEVLNFAIPGSTSFTGLVFLKGVCSLFKPDIILWNYSLNDSMFMRGNLQEYRYLEKLYTQKKFFFHRLMHATYSFNILSNVFDTTIIKSVLYFFRFKTKENMYAENVISVHAFCKKNNIQLVLIHETSDDILWFRYDRGKKKLLQSRDSWYYSFFRSFSRRYHTPYLFTVPELVKHREDRLYLDPIHHSKAGHDVMADRVYDFLRKEKLVSLKN